MWLLIYFATPPSEVINLYISDIFSIYLFLLFFGNTLFALNSSGFVSCVWMSISHCENTHPQAAGSSEKSQFTKVVLLKVTPSISVCLKIHLFIYTFWKQTLFNVDSANEIYFRMQSLNRIPSRKERWIDLMFRYPVKSIVSYLENIWKQNKDKNQHNMTNPVFLLNVFFSLAILKTNRNWLCRFKVRLILNK